MSWNPDWTLPAEFGEVAQRIYRSDGFWLGENTEDLQRLFSRANRYFEQNRAWVGVRDGKARLAGFFEPGKTINDEAVAFFGYWEGEDQLSLHQDLFREFEDWARAQGAKTVYGPINFTTYSAYRLRLDKFEQGCFPGEPWNPSYYPALMEALGYSIGYRYRTDIVHDLAGMMEKNRASFDMVRAGVKQAGFTLTELTGDYWLSQLDYLYEFVDAIFGGNFAYSRISKEAFVAACGEPFAKKLCPKSSVLALDGNGDMAGFFLNFPDYGPLCRRAHAASVAAPVALADANYAEHFDLLPHPRLALAKTTGVHPRYRKSGLFVSMAVELTARSMTSGFDHAAGCLVREDNFSALYTARHGQETRWYALYAKSL